MLLKLRRGEPRQPTTGKDMLFVVVSSRQKLEPNDLEERTKKMRKNK